MIYGSVCSGIEAASAAWHPLGWRPAFFSEIEAFPRAVLQHRFPDVPLHGDFTTIGADQYGPIDLLVGGTPCQSFSIAGLRGGLDDDRGNLALEFLRLADRTRARWVVWENVPGVLSSNGGRDFGSILGGLGELGYGWAYRVLDAQFFGVAQRRRRVFVVGHLGDWRRAAAVLFERHSLSGHPAPGRQTGEKPAGTLKACAGKSGTPNGAEEADRLVVWPAQVAPTLNAAFGSKQGLEDQHIGGGRDYLSLAQCLTTGTGQRYDAETETLIPMHGGGFDVVPLAFDTTQITSPGNFSNPKPGDACHPLAAGAHPPAVAFGETARTLSARHDGSPCADRGPDVIAVQSAVRRLTPRECERLQGFEDDWTLIPYRNKPADQCPDGPRYKALGNSMAVPCMVWLGQRIQMVDDIIAGVRDAA